MGATDCGIKDELLRCKIIKIFENMTEKEYFNILSIFVRDKCLSEEALKNGYSIEDAIRFIKWLRDYMDQDIL